MYYSVHYKSADNESREIASFVEKREQADDLAKRIYRNVPIARRIIVVCHRALLDEIVLDLNK